MKKGITAAILAIAMTCRIWASGYPVFDMSGWLAALDQLYQEYEMVMNQITTIENQYRMISHAIEQAKSIDWENIGFDGDFDIRSDIKDANRRINRLLTQARNIKEMMTAPTIDCGYGRYSLADLCGMRGADYNFFAACTSDMNYMTDGMASAVSGIVNGLSPKQKLAIWAKYGISPKNYMYIQQSVAQVKDGASRVIAQVSDSAREMKREEDIMRKNNIIMAAEMTRDTEGNITEGAANEAQLQLTGELLDRASALTEAVENMSALAASRLIADENQKQAEAAEGAAASKKQDVMDRKVPDYFRK